MEILSFLPSPGRCLKGLSSGVQCLPACVSGALSNVGAAFSQRPVLALGATTVVLGAAVYVYLSTESLEQLRERVKEMAFEEVIKNYGWNNLFRCALLSPEEFLAGFRAYADQLTFKELFDLHAQASAAFEQLGKEPKEQRDLFGVEYVLPSLHEWKEKFCQEVKEKSCEQILAEYPLEQLVFFHLVTEDQAKTLEAAAIALSDYALREETLEREFQRRTPEAHQVLQRAKESLLLEYNANPIHVSSTTAAFCRNAAELLIAHQIWDHVPTLATVKQLSLGQIFKSACTAAGYVSLHAAFAESARTVQTTLKAVESLRDKKLALAQEEFALATASVRREMQPLFSSNKMHLEERMNELNQKLKPSTRPEKFSMFRLA